MLNAGAQGSSTDGLSAAARGVATRERILREAFPLIGEVGWSRVTTRLPAGRVSVNAALINYHFPGKDGQLRDAAAGIEELVGPAVERMVGAGEPGSAVADVRRFLASELTPARDAASSSSRCAPDAEVGRLMTEQLRVPVPGGAGKRSARCRSDRLAVIQVGLLYGVLLQHTIDPETDVETSARALEQLLRAADGTKEEGT